MNQAENPYQQDVFLEDLRNHKNRQQQRIWAEHQQMQLNFMKRRGLTPSSTVLDIGCGPMRLGSALIPCSMTVGTLDRTSTPPRLHLVRRSSVNSVFQKGPYTLFASDHFDFSLVDRPVQIAFANSVFSHLTLNSIFTALLQLHAVLAPSGVFYSTFFFA